MESEKGNPIILEKLTRLEEEIETYKRIADKLNSSKTELENKYTKLYAESLQDIAKSEEEELQELQNRFEKEKISISDHYENERRQLENTIAARIETELDALLDENYYESQLLDLDRTSQHILEILALNNGKTHSIADIINEISRIRGTAIDHNVVKKRLQHFHDIGFLSMKGNRVSGYSIRIEADGLKHYYSLIQSLENPKFIDMQEEQIDEIIPLLRTLNLEPSLSAASKTAFYEMLRNMGYTGSYKTLDDQLIPAAKAAGLISVGDHEGARNGAKSVKLTKRGQDLLIEYAQKQNSNNPDSPKPVPGIKTEHESEISSGGQNEIYGFTEFITLAIPVSKDTASGLPADMKRYIKALNGDQYIYTREAAQAETIEKYEGAIAKLAHSLITQGIEQLSYVEAADDSEVREQLICVSDKLKEAIAALEEAPNENNNHIIGVITARIEFISKNSPDTTFLRSYANKTIELLNKQVSKLYQNEPAASATIQDTQLCGKENSAGEDAQLKISSTENTILGLKFDYFLQNLTIPDGTLDESTIQELVKQEYITMEGGHAQITNNGILYVTGADAKKLDSIGKSRAQIAKTLFQGIITDMTEITDRVLEKKESPKNPDLISQTNQIFYEARKKLAEAINYLNAVPNGINKEITDRLLTYANELDQISSYNRDFFGLREYAKQLKWDAKGLMDRVSSKYEA